MKSVNVMFYKAFWSRFYLHRYSNAFAMENVDVNNSNSNVVGISYRCSQSAMASELINETSGEKTGSVSRLNDWSAGLLCQLHTIFTYRVQNQSSTRKLFYAYLWEEVHQSLNRYLQYYTLQSSIDFYIVEHSEFLLCNWCCF